MAIVLRQVHTTNAWLVLVAGCVAAGVLLVEALHRGRMARGGLALDVFALVVYLQVVSGASTALVKIANHDELFGGSADKAFWHAALGICAAILVTLALWMRRKNWRVSTVIVAFVALLAPSLGRSIPLLAILAVCWVLAEVAWRRSTHARPPAAHLHRQDYR